VPNVLALIGGYNAAESRFASGDAAVPNPHQAKFVVQFTLYGRSYCHLCDDMLEALQPLSSEYPFTIEMVDVDSDEALIAQFDELVPVLYGRKGQAEAVELCHYFFDEGKARAFLTGA
jgi:thiol-disulfide isomerase/thioredoxin